MPMHNPPGKYSCDLDHYHRKVKPALLSEFRKMKSFTSRCGSNPDFVVDRKGIVTPQLTKRNKDNNCSKKKFSVDLNDYPDILAIINEK
ncbi:hypothetical protein FISHEDRAFT_69830 [Fistulina hepatica ATCC 64428]|uniref:Uncharacterized protein n=1 Tax=Fistulina hepatica ATCC 64428 TaxID=1128425 RepID=A0A0D7ALG2_9AGAR|nr:hypothetical protein FISHEDRAFT_69830 [Fistulina hepatica ATCC 64428]